MWRERGYVVFFEQSEQSAHLGEGLSGAALRRQQAFSHSGPVPVVDHPERRDQLQDGDADAVPNHIVELARNAAALGRDRRPSLFLPFPMQHVGLL